MPEPSNHSHGPDNSEYFRSILFFQPESRTNIGARQAPEFFADLKIDQIVDSITAGRDEYDLKPLFYTLLRNVESIIYRQDVWRDLQHQPLLNDIRSFSRRMRTMREHLAQAGRLPYKYQQQSWFLSALNIYCAAVGQLQADLSLANLCSAALSAFRESLASYTGSDPFASLVADTRKAMTGLSGIRYCLNIDGARVEVSRYAGAPDYGADVLRSFEKFRQMPPKQYRFDFPSDVEMNHVEAAVLDLVALLYPDVFSFLEECSNRHRDYLESGVAAFDREVQFYLACLDHLEPLKQAGLPFCYPTVTGRSKEVFGRDVFDLALADRLVRENRPVVTNDFYLRDPERILVVSGANQGGKTTFARTFGQLHFLARIGCQVPGCEARLFFFDQLFTHFEREEDITRLSGKLEDDLLRIHRILESATPGSIIILNESFLSTTLQDALFLSRQVMRRIIERGILCVSVSYLDELASLGEATVSMVGAVDPEDPAIRTFKVVRRPADGLAYAVAIAEKYRLTYQSVKERLAGRRNIAP